MKTVSPIAPQNKQTYQLSLLAKTPESLYYASFLLSMRYVYFC